MRDRWRGKTSERLQPDSPIFFLTFQLNESRFALRLERDAMQRCR